MKKYKVGGRENHHILNHRREKRKGKMTPVLKKIKMKHKINEKEKIPHLNNILILILYIEKKVVSVN